MTFKEGLDMLKETFNDYMQTTVLNHVEVDELGKKTFSILKQIYKICNQEIFFIGLPMKKFPDFENIVDAVLSGDLLDEIGAFEPYESALSISSDMDALNQQPGARSLQPGAGSFTKHRQRDKARFNEPVLPNRRYFLIFLLQILTLFILCFIL